MTPIRKQMPEAMKVRGMAERTQEAYVNAVAGLAKFYHTPPDQLNERQVQRYLLYMLDERKLSWSTCNQAYNALKFFYHATLKRPDEQFCIPRARQPQKLPEILSRQEVERLLLAAVELKHRCLLMTVYGAGLRVGEAVRLKVSDIDSERMTIRVEQGKGKKDRYTVLSQRLLGVLRQYWLAYRPRQWLFTNRRGDEPLSIGTAQKIFYRAKKQAGITKQCGIHGLRHAFATHMLEAGVDLHTIQKLLGHGHIGTTMRYLHLSRGQLAKHDSPLDLLELPDQLSP
jgi:integrase/recombinase XerD